MTVQKAGILSLNKSAMKNLLRNVSELMDHGNVQLMY